jgi:hypothetical protein
MVDIHQVAARKFCFGDRQRTGFCSGNGGATHAQDAVNLGYGWLQFSFGTPKFLVQ